MDQSTITRVTESDYGYNVPISWTGNCIISHFPFYLWPRETPTKLRKKKKKHAQRNFPPVAVLYPFLKGQNAANLREISTRAEGNGGCCFRQRHAAVGLGNGSELTSTLLFRWCLNPKGLLNGTLSHPFGTPLRVQVIIFLIFCVWNLMHPHLSVIPNGPVYILICNLI